MPTVLELAYRPQPRSPREERVHGLHVERPGEEIPLSVAAAKVQQVRDLVVALDPLGDDLETQCVAELDDDPRDSIAVRLRRQ